MAPQSTSEVQTDELTALREIFDNDFRELQPQAWKTASHSPHFTIRVTHNSSDKVSFVLDVQFPKGYPERVPPTLRIEPPTPGLTSQQVNDLRSKIQREAQRLHESRPGEAITYDLVDFAKEYLDQHVTPPIDIPGSLASQMTARAREEERQKKEKEELLAAKEAELEIKKANELSEQIAEARQAQVQQRKTGRPRGNSETTEVPSLGLGDTVVEHFSQETKFAGETFKSVKVVAKKSRNPLYTTYVVEPICDNTDVSLPLDLIVASFGTTPEYATSQGRKKLRSLDESLRRLVRITADSGNVNLIRILAVKLVLPTRDGMSEQTSMGESMTPRLIILTEQPPALTLYDVLDNLETGGISESKATQYLGQILQGIHLIHAEEIKHEGLNPHNIHLEKSCASNRTGTSVKTIKISEVLYHTELMNMYRSNPWGHEELVAPLPLSDGWLCDVVKNESTLVYNRARDIHDIGVVFMQMLMGLDVVHRFDSIGDALTDSSMSDPVHSLCKQILLPSSRKSPSCFSLLASFKLLDVSKFVDPLRSPTIPVNGPKTPLSRRHRADSSPEMDYFKPAFARPKTASRWKEDWEEIEHLGKGGFGRVVKAKNKLDGHTYAVKKIKLRPRPGELDDNKIFGEVKMLSQLSHPYIVRYYTAWLETSESSSASASESEDSESDETSISGFGNHSRSSSAGSSDGSTDGDNEDGNGSANSDETLELDRDVKFSFHLEDLAMEQDDSHSRHSFPSVVFERSSDGKGVEGSSSESSEEDDDLGVFDGRNGRSTPSTPTVPLRAKAAERILYIQMEFASNHTLKELVDDGLSESDAWRLFRQVLDGLVHMATLGILHRDIKLTNIFIDYKGNCKIGDFGLATSTLADELRDSKFLAVDMKRGTPSPNQTIDVGTEIYIAPEVKSKKKGGRSKADMYSLGIVFFEMNFRPFTTGQERQIVLGNLRTPDIMFPSDWDGRRANQKQVITLLLQHDPKNRPSARELSQNPLLPPRYEDEYFHSALDVIAKPDSPHFATVLSTLFKQPPRKGRAFLYPNEPPKHAQLLPVVEHRLSDILRLRGALVAEVPLLSMADADNERSVRLLDTHGDVVNLPRDLLVPFAKSAAHLKRMKRFAIADQYRPLTTPGHPAAQRALVFDMITETVDVGIIAEGAEMLLLVGSLLDSFPRLSETHEIHVSHSNIVHWILQRVPDENVSRVIELVNRYKASDPKSGMELSKELLKLKGMPRSLITEIEALAGDYEDPETFLIKVKGFDTSMSKSLKRDFDTVKSTIEYAKIGRFANSIRWRPLMFGGHSLFKDGLVVEVARKGRYYDALASGGRYDSLITQLAPPRRPDHADVVAFGMQISLDKIAKSLLGHLEATTPALIKDQKSFGYWSPRRCDVYIVSYQLGEDALKERLDVVSLLWEHNISADLMYTSIANDSHEEHCIHEGILFMVFPRHNHGRSDVQMYKVKSLLTKSETEVPRSELVGWLQKAIQDQKRVDIETADVAAPGDYATLTTTIQASAVKESRRTPDCHAILPDGKKNKNKYLYQEKAYKHSQDLKLSFSNGLPTLAVDVPHDVFAALLEDSAWVLNDEAWKPILSLFPPGQSQYATQVRDAIASRKEAGATYVLLYAIKADKIQILKL